MPRRKTWLSTLDADAREQLLDASAKMLASRVPESEIVRELAEGFEVTVKARAEVLAAGLARLVEWVGVPQDDPRFDALALCESVVRSDASASARMAAQDRIDKLKADEMAALNDEQIDEQIKLHAGEAAG